MTMSGFFSRTGLMAAALAPAFVLCSGSLTKVSAQSFISQFLGNPLIRLSDGDLTTKANQTMDEVDDADEATYRLAGRLAHDPCNFLLRHAASEQLAEDSHLHDDLLDLSQAAAIKGLSDVARNVGRHHERLDDADDELEDVLAWAWRQPCFEKQTGVPPRLYENEYGYYEVDWTGGFGGGQLVGSWSRVSTTELLALTGVQTNHFDDSGTGFGGGINGGYNWRPWSNNVVVGMVFDVNFLNDQVQHTFTGGTSIGSTINFTGSAQGRVGVLARRDLLLYGQTGVSVANQRLQINFGGPVTDQSQFTPGVTVGGGAEWMLPRPILPFGRSTSLFVDYRHTWWDKATLNRPDASSSFNYTWERQSDQVEGGLRFRFGGR